jgi:hypothetical protein
MLVSTDAGSLDDLFVVCETREYRQEGEGPYLGKQVRYWCEGCGYAHQIPVRPWAGRGDSWEWNGDVKLPVLSPSQLHTTYVWPKDDAGKAEADALRVRDPSMGLMMAHPVFGRRCHTFIGINGAPPGHVIFLGDCLHQLRGVRPLLPRKDWPDSYWAKRAEAS